MFSHCATVEDVKKDPYLLSHVASFVSAQDQPAFSQVSRACHASTFSMWANVEREQIVAAKAKASAPVCPPLKKKVTVAYPVEIAASVKRQLF